MRGGRAGVEIGGSAGATIHLWLRSNGRRHGYDDDDTVGPDRPMATIDRAGGGRNRFGVKCCSGTLKCSFHGTNSEPAGWKTNHEVRQMFQIARWTVPSD
jgi:hypothetical protein